MAGTMTSHQAKVCLYHRSKTNDPIKGITRQIQIDMGIYLKKEIRAGIFLTDSILLETEGNKKNHFRYTPIFPTPRC